MDYCLLEDAFKGETIGCKDNVGTEKAHKHERKKMKKSKDYFKSVDPTFNPKATDANCPAAKEYSEAFQNITTTPPPTIPKEINTKLPSYFLGGEDDDINEGFTSQFSKVDDTTGFDKASGSVLPTPSIRDKWKPITPSTANTSYFDTLPTPGGTYPMWNTIKSQPREIENQLKKEDNSLHKKIDELIKRLDELEKQHTYKPNNQQEILAFVGTGIFVIFSLSLLRS
jgi:hypothetical protein